MPLFIEVFFIDPKNNKTKINNYFLSLALGKKYKYNGKKHNIRPRTP